MGSLIGKLKNTQGLTGKVNNKEVLVYPELENLEVTPTAEEQNFKSSKYGFDNVKVKPVEGDMLEVTPSLETQNFTGLYEEVNVKAIETEELNVKPITREQNFDGLYSKVTVEAIDDLENELTEQGTLITSQETTIEDIILALENKSTGGNISLQEKTVEITKNGTQSITADEGYDGLNKVNVAANVKYKPRYITFYAYSGEDLNEEIANLDTSNITEMKHILRECRNLKSIDLSNVVTNKVTTFNSAFYNAVKLTTIDISSFDGSKAISTYDMFFGCSSLSKLIINNQNIFPMTNTGMLQNTPIASGAGYVYVPDNLVNTYKSATNWSLYANQIRPISELEVI